MVGQNIWQDRPHSGTDRIVLTQHRPLTSHTKTCSTSRDQADGAEEPTFSLVHLQGQQLASELEHLVGQRTEASVVYLGPGEGESVGEGHGVLVRSVACADPQDLNKVYMMCVECGRKYGMIDG